jgi:hypothetical protein
MSRILTNWLALRALQNFAALTPQREGTSG